MERPDIVSGLETAVAHETLITADQVRAALDYIGMLEDEIETMQGDLDRLGASRLREWDRNVEQANRIVDLEEANTGLRTEVERLQARLDEED